MKSRGNHRRQKNNAPAQATRRRLWVKPNRDRQGRRVLFCFMLFGLAEHFHDVFVVGRIAVDFG